jgi:hypothetical protein
MGMYIKRKSQKQEERTAKDFGGKTQIASGAIAGMKGDVRTGGRGVGFNESDFLIENKFTDDRKYSLKLDIWNKIAMEALRDNMRTPAMQIDIADKVQIVVLDYKDFMSMEFSAEWEHTFTTEIKGKSITIKEKDIENMEDVFRPAWKLSFVKNKVNLVVLMLSDFKYFLNMGL